MNVSAGNLHLHGEDEEAAEAAESTLVEDAVLGPEDEPQPVPLLQGQRHAVGAAAVGTNRVVDGEHVLAVLQQCCVQGPRVSHAAGEPDVVESLCGSSEDACRQRTISVLLTKTFISENCKKNRF